MIYLDNSATTQLCPESIQSMKHIMEDEFYNPSSIYKHGVDVSRLIERNREFIAKALKAEKRSIIFTSGGTESTNAAILSTFSNNKKKHIITTTYEHPSTLETIRKLEQNGFLVSYLSPSSDGTISCDKLKSHIQDNTALVSVMSVNNETGIINDIPSLGKTIKDANPNTIFHVDAIQGFLKLPIDAEKTHADFISISSHKVHGPKGCGALFIKKPETFNAFIHGGGQERGLRSGTENTIGISGFGSAVEIGYANLSENIGKISKLKERMIILLKENFQENEIQINSPDHSVCHILNVSFLGIKGEILLHSLEEKSILVSTGSACSSKKNGSHVLSALGLSEAAKEGAIRFSFSHFNTMQEIETSLKYIVESIKSLRKWMPKK